MANILNKFVEQAGDFNPQLFRELKGRLTLRNLILTTVVGILGQLAFVYFFVCYLPLNLRNSYTYNRYCLGSPPPDWDGYHQPNRYVSDNFCVQDLLGNWVINWQLWWLDLFITLSVIGFTILLVVGTYLLVSDLVKEEKQGTLNFIRLSPQSAQTIFLGKLLGVPCLLYSLTLLTIPLHFISGIMAGIPIILILAFYAVLIASTTFFFHIALLIGLMNSKFMSLQAFALSGGLLFYSLIMMVITLWSDDSFFHSPLDWFSLFYPGKMLVYLVQSTFLPFKTIGYLKDSSLSGLLWYGQPIFANPWAGISFILLNYSIWTYVITRAINRRFRRPHSVALSKQQSYGLTLGFIVIILGFVVQKTDSRNLYLNFVILQFFLFAFLMILTAALSSQRQTLQDWARYRHQFTDSNQNPHSLFKDLIWGEKSPSTVAIALNTGIIFLYTLPAIFIFPLENYRLPILMGLLLGLSMNLFYALIFQRLLLLKTSKRLITAISSLSILTIFPLIGVVLVGARFHTMSNIWFLTFMPMIAGEKVFGIGGMIALLGQWTLILLVTGEMTKQLKIIGSSESQRLSSKSGDLALMTGHSI